jgi:hypothetical protein
MCVCFCHYVEQQLQELHDDAQVMVTRLLGSQQQQQQQDNNAQLQPQQQQYALANGSDHGMNNSSWQAARQQQQQSNGMPAAPGTAANGAAAAAAASGGSLQQQEDEQLSQAAAAKLRVLAKPVGEFSTCRREWVLKLGKAAALGFMQHAAGARCLKSIHPDTRAAVHPSSPSNAACCSAGCTHMRYTHACSKHNQNSASDTNNGVR